MSTHATVSLDTRPTAAGLAYEARLAAAFEPDHRMRATWLQLAVAWETANDNAFADAARLLGLRCPSCALALPAAQALD
jgi:hypothetical protein